jgi:hypothetical protein
MDKFTDDASPPPQDNVITRYLNDQSPAVQDSREKTQAHLEELRADVDVPDLVEARKSYQESLHGSYDRMLGGDVKKEGERDIELTTDDDFLPYLHDVESSYDLREQAYQDREGGVTRPPGEVSNEFLLPDKKTIMGIDVATDRRILRRGNPDNKVAQEAYSDGIKKIRESTFNVNEGYDINGLSGMADIAKGIQEEGGTYSDYERAINMMGVPPEQAKLGWHAETARRAQEDLAARLDDMQADIQDQEDVDPPPPPDIDARDLPQVEGWRDATALVYEMEEGKPFSGTDDQLVDWYIDEMSSFHWKIGIPRAEGVPGINSEGMAYYMVRAMQEGPEFAQALLSMVDTYERVNTSWDIVGKNIGNLLTDPVNLVGVPGGGALGMKVGGMVAKKAMTNWLTKAAAIGAGGGAVEGTVWGGGEEAMHQQIEKEAGYRDEMQYMPGGGEPGIIGYGGMGMVAGTGLGAVLGPGIAIGGAGLRRGARAMRQNARGARRAGPLSGQIGAINPAAVKPFQYRVDVPPELEGMPTIDNAQAMAESKHYPNMKEFKQDMQDRAKELMKAAKVDLSKDTAKSNRILSSLLLRDALSALRDNANAVGWYNDTIGATKGVLQLMHPELKTDPQAEFAFLYALANTSNGLKVDKNFEIAEEAYRHWKATGRMPRNGIGNASVAINKKADMFNDLQAEVGLDEMATLFDGMFTVKQLKMLGYDVSGELAGTNVRGAAIMGPKIGNGFFSNLRGRFDQLTMDRWYVRTWGRLTGTLIDARPDMVKQKSAELREVIGRIKSGDPLFIKALKDIGVNPHERGIKNLAKAIEKSSTRPENREIMNQTSDGDLMRRLGNSLSKYVDGQKEAPGGGEERNRMRAITRTVLDELHKEYPDLTMSDLQAILWYSEKRLYDKSGTKDEVSVGYEDDEAPDYANAAAALARSMGFTEEQIAKADKDGRTAAAGRGAGEDGQQGSSQEDGGEAERRSRRKFLLEEIYSPNRPGGGGDGEVPESFTVKSTRNDRELRGVAGTYKPRPKLKSLLTSSEVGVPTIHELTPERAPDFHKAISQSKANSKYGAAVYVYDEAEYADMRLFQTEDGSAGLAIKPDGDIVSEYSSGGGNIYALLQLAVEMGGTKLDAFDTVLPEIYKHAGFVETERVSWDDAYAPEGWSKETFEEFNHGEPDIVFMVHQSQVENE